MNALVVDCILLAQQAPNPLDNISKEFQGRDARVESGYLVTGLVVLVGIVVAVWFLAKLWERYEGCAPQNSPRKLFFSLCRAHRLRWSEWWLLWRVARDQKLDSPARLFLEPERLDPASLSPFLRLRAPQLAAIRSRLFAGLSIGNATQPPPAKGDEQAANAPKSASTTDPPSSPVVPAAAVAAPDPIAAPPASAPNVPLAETSPPSPSAQH
ncbi:MAG: hypothetical protein ACYTG0_08440 [Planctomycetota bacterium]|jgi:hypothetical protein